MTSQMGWPGIRDRVIAVGEAKLRARGRAPSRFPVFEPALSAEEVAEVEAQYGVTLPEEYRTFLMEVGAGGPGPSLRLMSLRRVAGTWGWVWDNDEENAWPLDPSGPFVETADWPARQLAILRGAGHEPTSRDPENDYRDDYEQVFGEKADERWHFDRGRGAVPISDNGCGMTDYLIIIGPHRGELRDRDCGYSPPFDPYLDANGNHYTFQSRYLEWLEKQEVAIQRSAG